MFIGGPGNISTSTVQEIQERNHEVAIFTLPESPDKGMKKRVKFYRGDRNNAKEIKAVLYDFKTQMSADVCCFTPAQSNGLA